MHTICTPEKSFSTQSMLALFNTCLQYTARRSSKAALAIKWTLRCIAALVYAELLLKIYCKAICVSPASMRVEMFCSKLEMSYLQCIEMGNPCHCFAIAEMERRHAQRICSMLQALCLCYHVLSMLVAQQASMSQCNRHPKGHALAAFTLPAGFSNALPEDVVLAACWLPLAKHLLSQGLPKQNEHRIYVES